MYEILVVRKGKHYFATHERSLQCISDRNLIAMLKDFRARFPEEEGFEISLTIATTNQKYYDSKKLVAFIRTLEKRVKKFDEI